MHNIVPKLLIYGDMPKDSILMELCDIFSCSMDALLRDDMTARSAGIF